MVILYITEYAKIRQIKQYQTFALTQTSQKRYGKQNCQKIVLKKLPKICIQPASITCHDLNIDLSQKMIEIASHLFLMDKLPL